MIKKFLKFRLSKWKNKEYVAYCANKKKHGEECHHLIQKQYTDLFLVNIPSEQHKRIHQTGYKENEFEDLLVKAILNIQEFIDANT